MRKNYFKLAFATVLMFMLGMSVTSCSDDDNDK
jgi:hypothetical protein